MQADVVKYSSQYLPAKYFLSIIPFDFNIALHR